MSYGLLLEKEKTDVKPKNLGLILEPVIAGEDYIFGGYSKLKGTVLNESGDWLPFLPDGEHQAPIFETNSCVSHGTLNAIEVLYKRVLGEQPNFSDRFIAKGSGTNPQRGNSPKAVADFFRKNWAVLDTDWPMSAAQSVDDYYRELPDELYAAAKKLKNGHAFGYEYVTPSKANLQEALRRSPIGMSVGLMPGPDGIYYKPEGWRDGHWVTLVKIRPNGNYVILDSYPPFIKEIRADFVSEYAMRYELDEQVYSLYSQLLQALQALLAKYAK